MSDSDDVRRRTQGRSPPFPFIPLGKAVEQARKFEGHSRGHAVRVSTAGGAWGYKPGSSSSLQTVAALKAFGLISDMGSREDRRMQLTDFAKRLFRSPPAEVERRMLQEAALQPRLIREFWEAWGTRRPPDEECRWALIEEKGFTDDAASKFLAVYDDTITYAGLAEPDRLSPLVDDTGGDTAADPEPPEEPAQKANPRLSPTGAGEEIQLMEGERVVFTHEVEPQHHLRLVVKGEVDEELLEGLEAFLELQRKRLERRAKRREVEEDPGSSAPSVVPTGDPSTERRADEMPRHREHELAEAAY